MILSRLSFLLLAVCPCAQVNSICVTDGDLDSDGSKKRQMDLAREKGEPDLFIGILLLSGHVFQSLFGPNGNLEPAFGRFRPGSVEHIAAGGQMYVSFNFYVFCVLSFAGHSVSLGAVFPAFSFAVSIWS